MNSSVSLIKLLSIAFFFAATLGLISLAQSDPAKQPEKLQAPTYYISAMALCDPPDNLSFRGVSNLPTGALISTSVKDFYQDAWKDYSDDVFTPVEEDGRFEGAIKPKDGMKFRGNLILVSAFMPYRPKQPDNVLKIVGKKGRNMGDMLKNPQMFQVSGWNYGLETIARASCGRSREN